VEAIDVQPIEESECRVGVAAGGVVGHSVLGGAEAGEVGRDRPPGKAWFDADQGGVLLREFVGERLRREAVEVVRTSGRSVEKHDRQ